MTIIEILAKRYELLNQIRTLRQTLQVAPKKHQQKSAIRADVSKLKQQIVMLEQELSKLDCREEVISTMVSRGCTSKTIDSFLRKINKSVLDPTEKDQIYPYWREVVARKQQEHDAKMFEIEQKRIWMQAEIDVENRIKNTKSRGKIGDGFTFLRGRPLQGGACTPK
jgi:hemerythrin superfamily protein